MTDQKIQYVVTTQDGVPPPSSSSLLSPHTKPSRGWLRLRQRAHKLWLLEAGASLLSLFIFGSIISTLFYFNNRIYGDASMTQSNMTKRPIIFPVLAFLSTIMRATMLLPVATAVSQLKWSWFRSSRRLIDLERFDEAARGIFGSAKLMFYLRFRCVVVSSKYSYPPRSPGLRAIEISQPSVRHSRFLLFPSTRLSRARYYCLPRLRLLTDSRPSLRTSTSTEMRPWWKELPRTQCTRR